MITDPATYSAHVRTFLDLIFVCLLISNFLISTLVVYGLAAAIYSPVARRAGIAAHAEVYR